MITRQFLEIFLDVLGLLVDHHHHAAHLERDGKLFQSEQLSAANGVQSQ